MVTEIATKYSSEPFLSELEAQKRDSLRNFSVLWAIIGMLWLIFVSWQEKAGLVAVPAYVSWLGAYLSHRLAHRSISSSLIILLLTMLSTVLLASYLLPSLTYAYVGVIAVITACALGAPVVSLGVLLVSWILTTAALRAAGPSFSAMHSLEILAFYAVVWCVSHLANLPAAQSVAIAIGSLSQAESALHEARDRRGELHRVVRALEEATYRIERMNSELLLARAEAETARTLKARFAAVVSHEMRGPLNLLLGFSQMMVLYPEKYGEPLPDSYQADIEVIHRNCEHLVDLVNDVLDLSQIEADSLPIVRARVDLRTDVVEPVLQVVSPLTERKGLNLGLHIDEDLPWLLADKLRLRQVLLNLLSNAARFTERGSITVRVWHEESSIHVGVQDTGPGISPEDMPKLFEEFSQLFKAETREAAGSGLGLAISKQLVELHQGRIWAESEQGVGTRVNFSLPLPNTVTPVLRDDRSTQLASDIAAHTDCVVVHDDTNVVRLLSRHLGGYRTVGISRPEDIAALLDGIHPRAIITTEDLRLAVAAELTGLAVDVPILSFRIPERDANHPMGGALAYLVKPVSPETLWALMRRFPLQREIEVLIVDDEPDAVRLLESMLSLLPRPYRILRAHSGQQALTIMNSTTPDIVFLDLVMPELGGPEVLESMRENELLTEVPVVIVSAQDTSERGLSIGGPIRLDFADTVAFSKGNQIMKSLLDTLSPRYLPAPEHSESRA